MKINLVINIIFLSIVLLSVSCSEKKDPLSVSSHPEGWNNVQSSDFHGKMVLESYANAANCQSCHGADYSGGTSNVSCSAEGCHSLYPHLQGIADSLSDNFHSKVISNIHNWDITVCRTCHGLNYDGEGYNKKNCLICHTQPNGPEACNTCHGNVINPAPPKDLSDNLNTTAIGVGAHQEHLTDTTWTTAYQLECSLCHFEPTTFSASGHIDNLPLPAEVNFSAMAYNSGESNPIWNHSNATCENIYCHGGFIFDKDSSSNRWGYDDQFIVGNNPQMNWTSVGTGQASCGSCHGLPPLGHIPRTDCNDCHPSVVDENYNIIDKNLHINGIKEVR